MSAKHAIRVTVNGVPHDAEVEPRTTLADFLRGALGLGGTHQGCEHGACGACTVLFDGLAMRACLALAVQADGHELVTIEGLAREGRLHPLQQAFVEERGQQCGFCTPGMILSALALLDEDPDPSDEAIKQAIGGNLCRCTGYESIVRSIRLGARRLREARAAAAGGAP